MLVSRRVFSRPKKPQRIHPISGAARGRSAGWTALAAMLLTTIGLAQGRPHSETFEQTHRVGTNGQAQGTQRKPGGAGLSAAAQAQISSTIGKDQTAYHAVSRSGGYRLENPNHSVSADFTDSGVQFHRGPDRWGMALRGYGYGDILRSSIRTAPRAADNRVEYRRDGLTEWYVNGPLGVEQGFTIDRAPAKSNGEPLTVTLALSGNLKASVDSTSRALTLSRDGAAVLSYSGLTAIDADGREQKAWMEVAANELRVRVDDAGARYPLTIDPYVQARKLTSAIQCQFGGTCEDGGAFNYLGHSVSVSYTGNVVVVGAPLRRTPTGVYTGAAYVFVKPPDFYGGWESPTPLYYATRLANSDGPTTHLEFGTTTAVSSDGHVIVVGAPAWPGGPAGAAYVFLMPWNGWGGAGAVQTENAKLTARTVTDVNLNGSFGDALAISGDAATIAVGAPGYHKANDDPRGATYVFYRPANGWVTAYETTRTIGVWYTKHGSSVSLNYNGTVMIVGAPQDQFHYEGSAHLYVRTTPPNPGYPDTWGGGARLEASDSINGDRFGTSVSTNEDASVVVVGAPGTLSSSNTRSGAAYVYVRPPTGWPTNTSLNLKEIAKLTATDGQVNDGLGTSVDISGDGNTIVAGASQAFQTVGPGAVYVFKKVQARPWTSRGEVAKLLAADGFIGYRFGFAAAMSKDASTIVAGAPYKTESGQPEKGAAYVFTGSAEAPKASTSTSIVSAAPNPVLVGQPMAVAVAVDSLGDPLSPSGTVTVRASTGETCTASAPSGSCNLTFATAIDRTIAATYDGDSSFSQSTSPNAPAQVVDFTVTATPPSQTITGKKATFYVDVAAVNGFTGTVALSCSGGPANSTCALTPTSITLPGSTTTAKATVTVPNNAPKGTYTITFAAASGSATRTATASLTLKASSAREDPR